MDDPWDLGAAAPDTGTAGRGAGGDAIRGDSFGRALLQGVVDALPGATEAVLHVVDQPGRRAFEVDWPRWAYPPLVAELAARGIARPWSHQIETAELARAGENVVVGTGTASGKSLGYQLPVLTALAEDPRGCALYLAPTKALGADQLRSVRELTGAVPGLTSAQPQPYDGDTPVTARRAIRDGARWIFTNPDMLHHGVLRGHDRWTRVLRHLQYVVVDECHAYRGVFGSHVGLVLRRLRRLARRWGADPVFILASATTADPGAAAARLIGAPCRAVTRDGSPSGARTVALWEPPLLDPHGGQTSAPVRTPAGSEAARIMAHLLGEGARTLTFVRSRRGAETTALRAREVLTEAGRPELAARVVAYRAGYLAEDRRALEAGLEDGSIAGAATTNALELGIDIAGLDAVVTAGYPGTVASFRQQAGRAGRRGQGALVVFVSRDDPLDAYLVRHPEALLGRPVEATVTDPSNPYLLGPHLQCAAVELPLTATDLAEFGAEETAIALVERGLLRRRGDHWYPTGDLDAVHDGVDLRGSGTEVVIIDGTDGRALGTIDAARACAQVHPGAVYLHRGESFVVDELDLDGGLAVVHPETPEYSTQAASTTQIDILGVERIAVYGEVRVALARVCVTTRVTGYARRLPGGVLVDQRPLDLPEQTLDTQAVVYTVTAELVAAAGIAEDELPGALHAAEHAAIGLLPLIATCDRWDIGGVSTALHADTGLATVFVHDGYAGGAGFAERGHARIRAWLWATLTRIRECRCESGCPACVQSPKCGNGNEPLEKAAAARLLAAVLGELGAGGAGAEVGGAGVSSVGTAP